MCINRGKTGEHVYEEDKTRGSVCMNRGKEVREFNIHKGYLAEINRGKTGECVCMNRGQTDFVGMNRGKTWDRLRVWTELRCWRDAVCLCKGKSGESLHA